MKLGLHLHGDTDIGPATDRGFRSWTVLDLDRGLISGIMSRIPKAEWADVLIHVRQMAKLDMANHDPTVPRAKAREAARIAWELHSIWPDTTFVISPLNEPEIESGVDTKEEFEHCAWYCGVWGEELHAQYKSLSNNDSSLGTKVLLGGRPSSPGHEEDGPDTNDWGYGYAILAPVWRLWYHILIGHLYEPTPSGASKYWYGLRIFRPPGFKDEVEGVDAGDPGGLYFAARELGMPILISEANLTDVTQVGAVDRVRLWLEDVVANDPDKRIVGIHWFIWTSPDPRFRLMQLQLRPALVDLWASWRAPQEKEEPMVQLFTVGEGVDAMLKAEADEPATDETWQGRDYSVTYGRSGKQYVYVGADNKVWVYYPKA